MKMSKKNMKKLGMAIAAIVVAAGAAVSNAIPVFAEPGKESGNSIVVNEGEIVLDMADIDALQKELDGLEAELPDMSKQPYYGTARKNRLNSKGMIDYANKTVVIDSSDFMYLADEIDVLESAYKANTVSALNVMGTFFAADGSISHEPDGISGAEAVQLSFDTIISGILQSQSVEHLAKQGIAASIADNLSKGTAAWVNGKLLIGNGADNDAYYRQGFLDGQLSIYDKASISYVYHEHSDSCYIYNEGHTHTVSCYDGATSGWKHHYDCSDDGSGCPGHPNTTCGKEESDSGYILTCKKAESTIESATIVFND